MCPLKLGKVQDSTLISRYDLCLKVKLGDCLFFSIYLTQVVWIIFSQDCIGAIDGTHIPAMVKGRDVSSYRNRHGTQSQNVLAACNFDLEFMYVLSGWEGSAHDSKLLADALSRRNGLEVPQGSYIVYIIFKNNTFIAFVIVIIKYYTCRKIFSRGLWIS